VVATYDTKGNRKDILALVAYKVQKVYKGDQSLTGCIVYIIEKNWSLGVENCSYFDTEGQYDIPSFLWDNGIRKIGLSTRRIFFLTQTEYPQIEASAKYVLEKKYTHLGGKERGLYVEEEHIIGLDSLVFKNRKDFHDFIRQFDGFTVPETTLIPEKPQQKVLYNEAVLDSTQYEMIMEKWG